MSDTNDSTAGQRVDEAFAKVRDAAEQVKNEVEQRAKELGSKVLTKLQDLSQDLDMALDELSARLGETSEPEPQ